MKRRKIQSFGDMTRRPGTLGHTVIHGMVVGCHGGRTTGSRMVAEKLGGGCKAGVKEQAVIRVRMAADL